MIKKLSNTPKTMNKHLSDAVNKLDKNNRNYFYNLFNLDKDVYVNLKNNNVTYKNFIDTSEFNSCLIKKIVNNKKTGREFESILRINKDKNEVTVLDVYEKDPRFKINRLIATV